MYENVRKRQFPSPPTCLTLRMSGRVSGTVSPPGFSLGGAVCWRPSCRHASCCHSTSTGWNLKGMLLGVSVAVITQSLSGEGLGLGLAFFGLGDTLLSKPVSFVLGYLVERKVWCVCFSKVVNFSQGTHTN